MEVKWQSGRAGSDIVMKSGTKNSSPNNMELPPFMYNPATTDELAVEAKVLLSAGIKPNELRETYADSINLSGFLGKYVELLSRSSGFTGPPAANFGSHFESTKEVISCKFDDPLNPCLRRYSNLIDKSNQSFPADQTEDSDSGPFRQCRQTVPTNDSGMILRETNSDNRTSDVPMEGAATSSSIVTPMQTHHLNTANLLTQNDSSKNGTYSSSPVFNSSMVEQIASVLRGLKYHWRPESFSTEPHSFLLQNSDPITEDRNNSHSLDLPQYQHRNAQSHQLSTPNSLKNVLTNVRHPLTYHNQSHLLKRIMSPRVFKTPIISRVWTMQAESDRSRQTMKPTEPPSSIVTIQKTNDTIQNKQSTEVTEEDQADNSITENLQSQVPSLIKFFPTIAAKTCARLVIVRQPELQYRARYLTEGSLGVVRDRTGFDYPAVKVIGWNGSRAVLHVFVAPEEGRVRPHMFYEIYLASTRETAGYARTTIQGYNAIEIFFPSDNDWTMRVDCVSIIKLRKYDAEKRLSEAHTISNLDDDNQEQSKAENSDTALPEESDSILLKRRPKRVRLIFRAFLLNEFSGTVEVVQACSEPITCSHIIGVPEITRLSLNQCSTTGGVELFVIGKNLGRDSHIFFQQVADNEFGLEKISLEHATGRSTLNFVWEKEAAVEWEVVRQTNLTCCVPRYDGPSLWDRKPILVHVIVRCGHRWSNPYPFIYHPPDTPLGKVPMNPEWLDTPPIYTSNGLPNHRKLPLNGPSFPLSSTSVLFPYCNQDLISTIKTFHPTALRALLHSYVTEVHRTSDTRGDNDHSQSQPPVCNLPSKSVGTIPNEELFTFDPAFKDLYSQMFYGAAQKTSPVNQG